MIISLAFGTRLFIGTSFSSLYSKSKNTKDMKIMLRIINYLRENSDEKLVIFNIFRGIYVKIILLSILCLFLYLFCSPFVFPPVLPKIYYFLIFPIIYILPLFHISYVYFKFQPRDNLRKCLKILIENFFDTSVKLIIIFCIFLLVSVIISNLNFENFSVADISNQNRSNQLTVAGICFTFAVGGTVILSIRDIYKRQIQNLHGKKVIFEEWFKEKEKTELNLTLFSISVSDLNNFNKAVEELRNKLEINVPINFIEKIKWLQYSIIGFYLIGCLCPFMISIERVWYLIIMLSCPYSISFYYILRDSFREVYTGKL